MKAIRSLLAWLAVTQGAIALIALAALFGSRPPIPSLPAFAALVVLLVCAAGAWLLFRVHRSAAALADEVEARKRTEQEARAADLAKSQLLANTSHEIRTPMNGVLGMADLLLRAELTAAQREQVELIRVSAEALLALVDNILDLTKSEAGHLELRPRDFRLRELLSEVVRLLTPQTAKGVELRLHVASEVPDDLHGDPVRLRQVLLNLASNAVRHTREGFVAVTVEARQGEANASRLRCEVLDTGTGIRPEVQARLFQPFARSGSATSLGGSGLGLVISKNVVELMGGEIGFESTRGVGSTFWFEVPLVAAQAAAASSRAAFNRREDGNRAARHRFRVLVVDDHPVNRVLALTQLRDLGYIADAVDSGQAALGLLAGRAYDAMLLDCGMPEVDGYETCRRLRAREGAGRRTPVIALTAFATDGEREKCLAAGMDDYLAKPYHSEDLAALLDRRLGIAAPASDTAETPPLEEDGLDQRLAALRSLGEATGQDTLAEVVEMFLSRGSADLDAMRSALARGEGESIADVAHSLRGSSGILGALALARVCGELEEAARGGDLGSCAARLAAVEKEYQTVRKRLAP